jgi:hypothetical protein
MGTSCRDRAHRVAGQWVVVTRHGNRSAFNGGRLTWSRYSEVRCLACGCFWRTSARYVETLRDASDADRSRAI